MEQTITQVRTSAPTTETKTYPVGTYWSSHEHYPRFYAIVREDCIITVSTTSNGIQPSVGLQDRLFSHDVLDTQIAAQEFDEIYQRSWGEFNAAIPIKPQSL